MPLVALMEQQASVLTSHNVPSMYAKDKESLKAGFSGYYNLIFVSPELLVTAGFELLETMEHNQKQRFSHVFIDETHCVLKW